MLIDYPPKKKSRKGKGKEISSASAVLDRLEELPPKSAKAARSRKR